MTIKAKPWEGGGAASVPDASETTKGKIQIATSAEATTGTNDLKAMTPLTVKERIDAALVGGVEYKGQIAVSAFSTLLNANQGDMYKISTGGTAGDGRTYEAGDTIIVNADMGGTFADSKLDKIDNTEIISSVNGQTGPVNIYADDTVLNIAGTGLSISGSGATSTLNADSATNSAPGIIEIATNAEATAGSATDKALVPSNLASVGTSQLNNDAGFITSVASASESTAGIIEIATNAEATAGSATNKALVPSNLSSVGTSQFNNDAGFITSAGVGNQITTVVRTGSSTSITAVVNALYSIGASSATVTLPSSSLSEGDLVGIGAQGSDKTNTTVSGTISNSNNTDVTSVTFTASRRGVVWFAYDSDTSKWVQLNDPTNFSSATEAGVIEIATNAEATAGSATDKALVPSNLASVGTSQLNNDAGFITSVASASESTAGIIEIATNAEATAGSATDKALVPSNVASLSIANTQVTGLGTASTAASTDFLSGTGADTLGGNLDVGTSDIISSSNADIDLAPDGTGVVVVRGNQTGGNNQGAIKLNCEQNSHGVTIKAPAHSATATYTLTLPTSDGSADQVLKTDGSGVLSWVDQSGGSGGGWTYSAITADPANAQAGYHYSCTGTFTITLPTSGVSAGAEIRVKNMGSGTITIDPQTQNIDGATTDYVMDIQFGAITLVSTGSHWEII